MRLNIEKDIYSQNLFNVDLIQEHSEAAKVSFPKYLGTLWSSLVDTNLIIKPLHVQVWSGQRAYPLSSFMFLQSRASPEFLSKYLDWEI